VKHFHFFRKKLEANFGSVEKLKEQTGLEEKELYFLVPALLKLFFFITDAAAK
jgi:hypothetical protein